MNEIRRQTKIKDVMQLLLYLQVIKSFNSLDRYHLRQVLLLKVQLTITFIMISLANI